MDSIYTRRAVAAVVFCSVASGAFLLQTSIRPLACPPGYTSEDPAEIAEERNPRMGERAEALIHARFGRKACVWRKLPESFMEVQERQTDPGRDGVPVHALRRALEQKKALLSAGAQAKVANASGAWSEYGVGPQVSDQQFVDGSRDGIPEVAGRADSFAYDPIANRLFVAITYGGIWMSQAASVQGLGNHWVPIGDNLPTLINSAVAWTPARGGRVITLTGEHTQGGNTYVGLGAFWSDDLGANWHQSAGLPDGAGAARLAVDQSNPQIVYAATHKGLFRSTDAGESFVNVNLPVSEQCAGVVENGGPCQLANVVTEVVIRQPGGVDATGLSPTQCGPTGCSVLAAVGYRAGAIPYADGTPQSPGNGLYRSETGEPGTFERLNPASVNPGNAGVVPVGFAAPNRIGRTEMGVAEGPLQDHNYVYAIVEDTVLFNNGLPILDLPTEEGQPPLPIDCAQLPEGDPQFLCELAAAGINPTSINGVYVSNDFGDTWIRLADDLELTYNLTTGSSLAAAAALGVGPGAQAWYNLWIKPDPTQAIASVPTRIAFGMEEIWQNNVNIPVTGLEQTPNDFGVFGTYFAGETCLFLIGNIGPPTPVCPVYDGVINGTTTHPDQHDGIFIPDGNGGVWLFAGNDGGVYKQHSSNPVTDPLANNKWGNGANQGFYTLFHYGVAVSKDGTVYYGLQDNASGKIEPTTRRQVRTYVGDGVWSAVNPDNPQIAFVQTPGLSINRTQDGGITHSGFAPGAAAGTGHFLSPFMMDPSDGEHLVAAGTAVAEHLQASTGPAGDWVSVFDLGVDEASGLPHQTRSRALDVQGDAIYAGWCGPCQVLNGAAPGGTFQFARGLATNVGGELPPQKGTADGWHQASANGLPNRYIYNIEIDENDPRTVYVVLGNYSTSRWLMTGQYEDENPDIGSGHVFKSTDAGENFVDISGDLPDIITTAIIKRGNQLVVGTDIGPFISSDLNGTQWAPMGSLPNVPINQFVLQPGKDDVLFAATFGRGVQTYTFTEDVPGTGGGGGLPPVGGGKPTEQRFGGAFGLGMIGMLLGAAAWRRRRNGARLRS